MVALVDAVALAWEAPDASHVSGATSPIRWSVAPFGLRGGAGLGVAAAF